MKDADLVYPELWGPLFILMKAINELENVV